MSSALRERRRSRRGVSELLRPDDERFDAAWKNGLVEDLERELKDLFRGREQQRPQQGPDHNPRELPAGHRDGLNRR